MVTLFGRAWDRTDLLRLVGDVRQVGGARAVVLDDGPERGVRAGAAHLADVADEAEQVGPVPGAPEKRYHGYISDTGRRPPVVVSWPMQAPAAVCPRSRHCRSGHSSWSP